jgi:hypothetical protein
LGAKPNEQNRANAERKNISDGADDGESLGRRIAEVGIRILDNRFYGSSFRPFHDAERQAIRSMPIMNEDYARMLQGGGLAA